jgi:hypothetical protein
VLVQTKPVDFVNEQWALMRIGPAYGEYAWTGVMQYDSVIAGPTPAPSRLELSGTGALTVGVCDSVKLAMTESFTGAAASLPWPTLIDLQVQGAAVFSDAGVRLRPPRSLPWREVRTSTSPFDPPSSRSRSSREAPS